MDPCDSVIHLVKIYESEEFVNLFLDYVEGGSLKEAS
jgi:hypothetical protein